MTTRILLQPAFVLHTRQYRDSSLLVNLFTRNYGRIDVVARGVRTARSKTSGLLSPFIPLLVSFAGKSELMTLTKIEANGSSYQLAGKALLSGFYLNELVIKLLHKHDPHLQTFDSYQQALSRLVNASNYRLALRLFEKELLFDIGYGLQLDKDASGAEIQKHLHYYYKPEHGFIGTNDKNKFTFSGMMLGKLACNKLVLEQDYKEAKILLQGVIQTLLGDSSLKTVEIFREYKN